MTSPRPARAYYLSTWRLALAATFLCVVEAGMLALAWLGRRASIWVALMMWAGAILCGVPLWRLARMLANRSHPAIELLPDELRLHHAISTRIPYADIKSVSVAPARPVSYGRCLQIELHGRLEHGQLRFRSHVFPLALIAVDVEALVDDIRARVAIANAPEHAPAAAAPGAV